MSSSSVDREVLERIDGARAEAAWQLCTERMARLGTAGTDHRRGALALEQLDEPGEQPIRALVAVAFLEQVAIGRQLKTRDLARQRLQVVLLHAVQRRKSSQHAQVGRGSVAHGTQSTRGGRLQNQLIGY